MDRLRSQGLFVPSNQRGPRSPNTKGREPRVTETPPDRPDGGRNEEKPEDPRQRERKQQRQNRRHLERETRSLTGNGGSETEIEEEGYRELLRGEERETERGRRGRVGRGMGLVGQRGKRQDEGLIVPVEKQGSDTEPRLKGGESYPT